MKHRIRFPLFALLMVVAVSPIPSATAARGDTSTVAALQAAIDGPQRSEANKARDKYRHPLETLTFFGIKPEMTVVEVWPVTVGILKFWHHFSKTAANFTKLWQEGARAKTFRGEAQGRSRGL